MNNVMEMPPKGRNSTQGMIEVDLNLTPEQVRALSGHAKAMSEGKIVLRMLSDDEVYGKVKVAAYTYSGSTCCC